MSEHNKETPAGKLYDGLCSFDIFGEGVQLNIKGKERYHTLIGSLFTLFIYVFITLFFIAGVREYNDWTKVPQINTMMKYNAYGATEEIVASDFEFFFAFGVTQGHNSAKQVDFSKYGELVLSYRTVQDEDGDEDEEEIETEVCGDENFHTYAPNAEKLNKLAKMFAAK